MVSVACNQKSIKEFTEHHDSKFISMKEFYPYIQMLTLGQSQGSVKESWGISRARGNHGCRLDTQNDRRRKLEFKGEKAHVLNMFLNRLNRVPQRSSSQCHERGLSSGFAPQGQTQPER